MPDAALLRTPTVAKLKYGEAINAALERCLEDVPETLLYGEDVAKPGGVFGVTRGLAKKFPQRVFDTPISESAILGSAVGSALFGRRPIVEIMWIDFSLVAFDQIANQMVNVRYVSEGKLSAPIVIRTQEGNAPGACAQHSQSLEALFLHLPGLRVCVPWSAQDAYDFLVASVYHDDPVLFIENRTLYPTAKQEVTVGGPVVPIGDLRVRREGSDVTVVTWGAITAKVMDAAEQLALETISVQVVETPWLNPFPTDAVAELVGSTGRLVVAHEANVTGGFGAEVVARIVERGTRLSAPPVRLGTPDVRIPAAPHLAASLIPDEGAIVSAVRRAVS